MSPFKVTDRGFKSKSSPASLRQTLNAQTCNNMSHTNNKFNAAIPAMQGGKPRQNHLAVMPFFRVLASLHVRDGIFPDAPIEIPPAAPPDKRNHLTDGPRKTLELFRVHLENKDLS